MRSGYIYFAFVFLLAFGILSSLVPTARSEAGDGSKVDESVAAEKVGSKTDDQVVEREEQAIKLDGLNAAQIKDLRDKAEKFTFQAEVDRMMKLIINSLYKNKEIFLRELISNASDALDKIRFLSLTNPDTLSANSDLSIKIKADKDAKTLHVIDTGIGMTKKDLVSNLGTIAKSGTSEFLNKMTEAKSQTEMSDLIGQFGVGFYSSFLVADRVTVITKHNDDKQYIWESDASSFSITEDPRGDSLKRGTEIILHMKDEGLDWLEPHSLRDLISKYSQFINFPIYIWESKTETVEEAPEKEEAKKEKKDEDATVEEEKDKAEPKKVEKTVWDWRLVNENKPIWTRKPSEIKDEEYNQFFKSFTKAGDDPLAKVHFVAEGEVTFKSILFVPKSADFDAWSNYGKKTDNIKMFVRRVFITDNFEEMMPKYLSFIKGIVDSDDLPLNVSRETLQQHKLLKVIKKKLVRKALDMIKKISPEEYKNFWKEYSTNIKVGIIDDTANRTKLSKLLRFWSSHDSKEQVSLADYVSRMKEKQENIYFMSGQSRKEVETSPFVESLLKKGYEVLFLLEPIDQYAIQSLPEFEGKKFQNAAKDGLNIDDSVEAKEKKEATAKEYEPLTKWLQETALKDKIEKAQISDRLTKSPCALVASQYGWDAAMDRVMRAQAYQKAQDPSQVHFSGQKKILEINPRHPLIKELKRRSVENPEDKTATQLATILYEAATLRSGYSLDDSAGFADRIEKMLRMSMNISESEPIDEEEESDAADEKKADEASSAESGDKKTDEASSAESSDKKADEPAPDANAKTEL